MEKYSEKKKWLLFNKEIDIGEKKWSHMFDMGFKWSLKYIVE